MKVLVCDYGHRATPTCVLRRKPITADVPPAAWLLSGHGANAELRFVVVYFWRKLPYWTRAGIVSYKQWFTHVLMTLPACRLA